MTGLPLGEVLVGCLFLGGTLGACAVAAALVQRRLLRPLQGATAVSAFGLVWALTVLLAHLLPLAAALLSREAVLLVAVALAGAATRLPRFPAPGSDVPAPPDVPDSPRWSWALAAAAAGGFAVFVLGFVLDQRAVALDDIDAMTFHLPQSGRWLQTGSLWQNDGLAPGWAFGQYPNTGDVFHMASMLPWSSDALVRFVNYPFGLLTIVALYATGVELGVRRSSSVLFAVLVAAIPTSTVITLNFGMTDVVALAGLAVGVLFGVRHARTEARADLVLAAAGLGLALGTKWYGLSCAAVLVLVWAVARLRAGRGLPLVVRQTALVAGVILVCGGIWLLRNLVISGNPVYPVVVGVGGLTVFDAPADPIRDLIGFSILHYATDLDVLKDVLWTALLEAFGFAGIALGAIAAGCVALGLRARDRVDGRVLALATGVLLLLALYVATPYSAIGLEDQPVLAGVAARYAMPALLLAAPVAAWLCGRYRRVGMVLELLAVVLLLDAIHRYTAFGLTSQFDPLEPRSLVLGTGAAVLLLGLAVLGHVRPWDRLPRRRQGPVLAAATVVAAALTVVAIDRHESDFAQNRYVGIDTAYRWLADNAPSDRRIGIAGEPPNVGIPPTWPAFGPRLSNHVEYVGPMIRHRMERYLTASSYVDALRGRDLDIVLVGLEPGLDRKVPELAWTRQAGYREVLRSVRVAVMVRG